MKFFSFIFSFLLLINVCGQAFAQLLIEQGKINLNVEPGETIVDSIVVHNTSKKDALYIKVYWEDFMYIPPFTGKKKFLPSGSTEYSCSKWVKLPLSEFTLAPLGKKNINYTVRIPDDAEGGYYSVLFFETGAKKPEGKIGLSIVSRLGSLFFIETDNKNKNARVNGIVAIRNGFRGNFLNEGNVIMIPKCVYYILGGDGLVEERGEIDKFYLPPGEKKEFDITLPDNLKEGKFTVVLTFDLGGGNSLVKEIDFVKTQGAAVRIIGLRD